MNAEVLRIGVDARSLLCREPRGEGKSLWRLYEHIARQAHVEVLLFGDARSREFQGRLPPSLRAVPVANTTGRWNLWENVALPLAAWRTGCHVLHCASSSSPRYSRVPVVMTVHDLIPLLFDDGHDTAARAAFRRRLERGLRCASGVIAVSEHSRRDLIRTFPESASRIEAILWGADEAIAPAPAVAPARTEPYLLCFGGEARRKNTDYVLDRFASVAAQLPSLKMVVTGVSAAWQQAHVAARLQANGLTGRVDLVRFVDEPTLDALIRGATLVFYPSLYEGFGLPVVEAIARGTPVLCSDCTSLPEILGDAPGCVALEPAAEVEALLTRLLTSDAFRQDWAGRQRSVLDRLRWADTAARTLAVLARAARREVEPLRADAAEPHPN